MNYSTTARISDELVINYPIQAVMKAVCDAASKEKGFKLKETNKLLNRVVVRTGVSLLSWGELVTIQLSEIDPTKTQITITSELATSIGSGPAQATIGRKNKKNIDKFLNALSKYL